MLCIGGPQAGKHIDSDAPFYRVAIRKPITASDVIYGDIDEYVVIKYMTYVKDYLHTLEGRIEFWVPEGQTASETMDILLQIYEAFYAKG